MSRIWSRLVAFLCRKREDPRDMTARRELDEQARIADRTADARIGPYSNTLPY